MNCWQASFRVDLSVWADTREQAEEMARNVLEPLLDDVVACSSRLTVLTGPFAVAVTEEA